MAFQSDRQKDALARVRVLDFTTVMAGPFATRMLADLGADVVKIESLEGDQVRARPPLRDGRSAYFAHLNAGKRSLAIDLKSADGVEIIKALVPHFDIVVENFRPGVMDRFGLGHEQLAALNPRLIYCAVSGYGQTGPKAMAPAYAPVVHAASGYDMVTMDYQNGAADRPANSGIFIADVLGGTHAFGAIQTALYQREKTGLGQFIDVSMLEAMVGMLVFETQQAQFPAPRRPLYTPLRTADGFIMVAPTSPRNFEQLTEAVGRSEWREDPRFRTNADRNANWDALLSLVEQWTLEHGSVEAEAILSRHGVPCGRYCDMAEVLGDPQLAAREAFATVHDDVGPLRVTNPPFKMSGSRVEARDHVSKLGEDGPDLLFRELGMPVEKIEELTRRRIIG
jgi:CoA:oxalate CoA-transferase